MSTPIPVPSSSPLRGSVGAIVRGFGFPGRLEVVAVGLAARSWRVAPIGRPGATFTLLDGSLVEVNGEQTALQSLPIDLPANDYPHGRTIIDVTDEYRDAWPGFVAAIAKMPEHFVFAAELEAETPSEPAPRDEVRAVLDARMMAEA